MGLHVKHKDCLTTAKRESLNFITNSETANKKNHTENCSPYLHGANNIQEANKIEQIALLRSNLAEMYLLHNHTKPESQFAGGDSLVISSPFLPNGHKNCKSLMV